jgi:Trk-type K+ transport system membrane component
MGPYNFPDLRPLFYLALIGIAALALMIVGGIGFAIWFVVNHVQIVGL